MDQKTLCQLSTRFIRPFEMQRMMNPLTSPPKKEHFQESTKRNISKDISLNNYLFQYERNWQNMEFETQFFCRLLQPEQQVFSPAHHQVLNRFTNSNTTTREDWENNSSTTLSMETGRQPTPMRQQSPI